MENITDRQLQILKAIIEEYIATAQPVASETLDKKYNLGVSPATIRNEMVKLNTMGYLIQPHTSAGRTPTQKALRLYVDKLMKMEELSIAEEVSVKQKIWEYRKKVNKLLKEATKALAQETRTMSLSATEQGDIYASGMSFILDMPEFYDIDMTKHLLETLDEYNYWWNIFSRMKEDEDPLAILLGDNMSRKFLNRCGGVFIRFESPNNTGVIGVVGPSRLNYPKIIPVVKYMGELINTIAKDWWDK